MYLAFYGLAEKPFNTAPDPRFLYHTPAHREALAQLTYAVREGKGFVVLTGDVGTGKTTLLRTLLEQLDAKTAAALVVNSTLTFDEILEYILEDLGVSTAGESRTQRLVALNNFLIERHRAGQKTIVIIDEAQHLMPQTLEQIRLLSNFQTTRETLLQILLAGQPELRERLALPELRQLKQRITLRCTIRPLTPDEVRAYVRFRLRVAGTRDLDLFTDRAIARIAAYSNGVPRVVNTVADHCLVIGYAEQRRRLDRDTVEEAIAYLEDDEAPPRRYVERSVRRWAVTGATALLGVGAVAVVAAALAREGLPVPSRPASGTSSEPPAGSCGDMSKFFKALEQADRDRALHGEQVGAETDPSPRPRGALPAAPSSVTPSPRADAPPTVSSAASPPVQRLAGREAIRAGAPASIDARLVSLLSPGAHEAEPYRALRHLIEQRRQMTGLSVLAVTSPGVGDGKTTTALNLAGALAQDPKTRVLLIDGDLRDPRVAVRLGLDGARRRGLAEAILDGLALDAVVEPCPPFNLDIVPTAPHRGVPYELLTSRRFADLIEEARSRYDYVLIDTPPLVAFPDGRILAGRVDGYLLVVSASRTPRKLVEEALALLDPAKLVGLVFNGEERSLSRYGYYYAERRPAAGNGRNGQPGSRWLSGIMPSRARSSRTVGGDRARGDR